MNLKRKQIMTTVIIEGTITKTTHQRGGNTYLLIESGGENNSLIIPENPELSVGDNIMAKGTLQTRNVKGTNEKVTAIVAEKIFKQV